MSINKTKIKIQIDGMAYSDISIVLVERKPRITVMYIEELDGKGTALR